MMTISSSTSILLLTLSCFFNGHKNVNDSFNSNMGVPAVVDAFFLPTTTVPRSYSIVSTGSPANKVIESSSSSRRRLPSLQYRDAIDERSSTMTGSSTTTALFGIPKMFRYLTDQYPDIVTEIGLTDDVRVDNLYLDMNGIIHPCTHGNSNEDGTQIMLDETAMFKKIFLYVDRLYKLVKPGNVLYLAVDGVAPRAKMNQQRSRRFRSAKEAEQLASTLTTRENFVAKQNQKPSSSASSGGGGGSTVFDSNCITPGTDFMLKLSLAMQKWVEYKQETDMFWKENGATVVVSGPDVPGEGEHKVMDYLRAAQTAYKRKKDKSGSDGDDDDLTLPIDVQQTHYDPNLTHVLYGLDADLISKYS
jgi:5'-3' exoribonuclease 1